ncbi:Membrane-bound lytic murein transglycosylase F [Bacteroides pyogenes]|uniref:Transporter substrate-binding domain-containing protein n=3 Tax=Bacteroides pyogenes TaxID=310300 RepID=A0A5D3FHU6_9BACE|nr:transporter substrate-binding domain-containing protein [Bacteroides pyogenes]GAE16751.1 transglycosylase [Bacteroides pyogenes JCM 6292]MBR8720806.1 Membrane-bound lytic murein transglycosylase F [Bacteroides pyogenes]MBR8724273.1 Membrane-bound lytic murein transglycosylase F [Bacteroides pyogenes]MBR8739605.1 Membrane-bound lytic murein transglycosylase F [Bacteroides pyogenes]MBR8753499.1 Membrane-bound lytic murein transglycosylase F [Bacteroides pyogenes]
MIKRILRYLLPVVLVSGIIFAFRYCGKREKPVAGHPRDYAAIAEEGILRAATEYNSTGFFVDQDTLSGFYYDLIQAFARDKGLKAEITPVMSFDDRMKGLSEGKYDIIAHGILATSELKDSLLLTSPIILNRQVLIQRKPKDENDSLYIRSQLDLAGRTLHVVKGSPSILRIRNLGDEIGDTIYVREIEKYGPEQLVSLVAHGDIDYAVCDESIAKALSDSLPQIDINTAISFTQFYSWAVSKQSPALLDSLDVWLDKFRKGKEFQRIYWKYYYK